MTPETPLARILREKRLRQASVAKQIPVHRSSLSRWVLGRRRIPAFPLSRLSEILDKPAKVIQPETEEKNEGYC